MSYQTKTKDPERRKNLEREVERYKNIMARHPEILGAIMFGSITNDTVEAESDIDLLIIEKTEKPFIKRIQALRKILTPTLATDIIAYTPEELFKLSRERPFVREELLGKGKIIYERKRGDLAEICP